MKTHNSSVVGEWIKTAASSGFIMLLDLIFRIIWTFASSMFLQNSTPNKEISGLITPNIISFIILAVYIAAYIGMCMKHKYLTIIFSLTVASVIVYDIISKNFYLSIIDLIYLLLMARGLFVIINIRKSNDVLYEIVELNSDLLNPQKNIMAKVPTKYRFLLKFCLLSSIIMFCCFNTLYVVNSTTKYFEENYSDISITPIKKQVYLTDHSEMEKLEFENFSFNHQFGTITQRSSYKVNFDSGIEITMIEDPITNIKAKSTDNAPLEKYFEQIKDKTKVYRSPIYQTIKNILLHKSDYTKSSIMFMLDDYMGYASLKKVLLDAWGQEYDELYYIETDNFNGFQFGGFKNGFNNSITLLVFDKKDNFHGIIIDKKSGELPFNQDMVDIVWESIILPAQELQEQESSKTQESQNSQESVISQDSQAIQEPSITQASE